MLDERAFGCEQVAAKLCGLRGVARFEIDEVRSIVGQAAALVARAAVGAGSDAADGQLDEPACFRAADEEVVFVEVAAENEGVVLAEEIQEALALLGLAR